MFIANADIILNERMESIFCYVNLYVGDCTSEVEWHQKLLNGAEMFVPAGQVWDCSWIALTRHNYLFLLCSESDSKKCGISCANAKTTAQDLEYVCPKV